MSFELSAKGVEFVKLQLSRYETKRSAILPCLYRVQQENQGWVSAEAVQYLSELMDVPQVWVQEVLDFYTMYNKKPIGKCHVQVCGNISCFMNGADKLYKHLAEAFNVEKPGALSQSGELTLSKVECLGACDGAPMMQIDDKDFLNLTPEMAEEKVREYLNQAKDKWSSNGS